MSMIEDRVCEKIQERAEYGERRYGFSVERGDLSLKEWIKNLQKQIIDSAVFLEKIILMLPEDPIKNTNQSTLDKDWQNDEVSSGLQGDLDE